VRFKRVILLRSADPRTMKTISLIETNRSSKKKISPLDTPKRRENPRQVRENLCGLFLQQGGPEKTVRLRAGTRKTSPLRGEWTGTCVTRIGDYASIDEDNPSSVSPSCVRFHKLQRSFHRVIAQFRKFVDRIARDALDLRLDQSLLVRIDDE
jgi:hypothetical protein